MIYFFLLAINKLCDLSRVVQWVVLECALLHNDTVRLPTENFKTSSKFWENDCSFRYQNWFLGCHVSKIYVLKATHSKRGSRIAEFIQILVSYVFLLCLVNSTCLQLRKFKLVSDRISVSVYGIGLKYWYQRQIFFTETFLF